VTLDDQYPYAQVYAPSGEALVALEPMTAPVNALVTGDHRTLPPGETMSATFAVRVDHVAPPPPTDQGDDR
jgi:aldose 1-epimerase